MNISFRCALSFLIILSACTSGKDPLSVEYYSGAPSGEYPIWHTIVEADGDFTVEKYERGNLVYDSVVTLSPNEKQVIWSLIRELHPGSSPETASQPGIPADSYSRRLVINYGQYKDTIRFRSHEQDKTLNEIIGRLHGLIDSYLPVDAIEKAPDNLIYTKDREVIDPYGNYYTTSKDWRDSSVTSMREGVDSVIIDYGYNGRKRVEACYVAGRIVNEKVLIDGRRIMEISYKDGLLHGTWYIFDPASGKALEHLYENGELVETKKLEARIK